LPDGAAGERLTGGVEVGDMGMKAIAVLAGGGTLLVGMRGDHGGVDVDHIRDLGRHRVPKLWPGQRLVRS
jgi:hypothetical protein